MKLRLVLPGLALAIAMLPLHAAALKESDLATIGAGLKARCMSQPASPDMAWMTPAENVQMCSCISSTAVTKLRTANIENYAAPTAADRKLVSELGVRAGEDCMRAPLARMWLKDMMPACREMASTMKPLKNAAPAAVLAACTCAIGKLASDHDVPDLLKDGVRQGHGTHIRGVLRAELSGCAAK